VSITPRTCDGRRYGGVKDLARLDEEGFDRSRPEETHAFGAKLATTTRRSSAPALRRSACRLPGIRLCVITPVNARSRCPQDEPHIVAEQVRRRIARDHYSSTVAFRRDVEPFGTSVQTEPVLSDHGGVHASVFHGNDGRVVPAAVERLPGRSPTRIRVRRGPSSL